MSVALERALRERAAEYDEKIRRLRDVAMAGSYGDERQGILVDSEVLEEAAELARCLARLVRQRTLREIHDAFGAPGDFGYGTPIGDALAKLYRGDS